MWAFTSPRLEARPSSQNPEGPWPVPQPQAENASGPPACRPSGGLGQATLLSFPGGPWAWGQSGRFGGWAGAGPRVGLVGTV